MSGQIRSRDAGRTPPTGGWIPETAASGFVCSETQCTTTSVLQFQARPRSSGIGCLRSGLVESDSICLPAFSNGREMSPENQGGLGRESSDSDPSMEEPSMVPSPPPHEHQQSLPSSPVEGSANEPSGRSAPSLGSGRTHSDRLAGVRQKVATHHRTQYLNAKV